MYSLLVHATNHGEWSPGVGHAATLAAGLKASLTGLYVCPSPLSLLPDAGSAPLLVAALENTRELEDSAEAAGAAFRDWARARGVEHAAWQVAEGNVPAVLAHAGNWHDLLVLEHDDDAVWGMPSALGELVLGVDLPCLVLPSKPPVEARLGCITVAWNGSPESIRAIHAARPLLSRAGRVIVLRGDRRDPFSEIGWRPPFDLGDYFRRQGIAFEECPLDTEDEQAGEALLRATEEAGADLLVMGAYGRTRFSEWVFGGATRHVLRHATVPVLMRH